jgi:hypothetical protein
MILVTNRNIIEQENVENRFGNTFNSKGPDELRLAEVTRGNGEWKMEIAKEGGDIPPSEQMFVKLQKK